jgi:hypothetical protein
VSNDDNRGSPEPEATFRFITLGELLAMDPANLPSDMRLYGKWRCADGREVLFNRGYTPIWQRYPGKPAERADATKRVKGIVEEAEYYWIDGRGTNAKGRRLLKEWGVQ